MAAMIDRIMRPDSWLNQWEETTTAKT